MVKTMGFTANIIRHISPISLKCVIIGLRFNDFILFNYLSPEKRPFIFLFLYNRVKIN